MMRLLPVQDRWKRYPQNVPLRAYGKGARHEFSWYLHGESSVEVNSLDQIVKWLAACTYTRDSELFLEADYWQHPCVFEALRQGDCEDFALWAWRKLARLGYDAEFVAGYVQHEGAHRGHAWVLIREGDQTYLFDPVLRAEAVMIVPLDEVAAVYVPEVSIDAELTQYVYGGYLHRRAV